MITSCPSFSCLGHPRRFIGRGCQLPSLQLRSNYGGICQRRTNIDSSSCVSVRLHQTKSRQQQSPFHFRSPAPPSSIVEKGNDRSIFFLLCLAVISEREEPNCWGQRPKASFMWIVARWRLILTIPNLQPSPLILDHHRRGNPPWKSVGVIPIRGLGLSGSLNIPVTRLSPRLISQL